MAKQAGKKKISTKGALRKPKKTANKKILEVLETTGHLAQLHKVQGVLLTKLSRQIKDAGWG